MNRLKKYKAGQHYLICDAVGCDKSYLDPGCTAYEAICVLLLKFDEVKIYLKAYPGLYSKELLIYLDAHHNDEVFSIIPLYGTEKVREKK